jgi:CRISPR-associated protein (TIGR03984 family)
MTSTLHSTAYCAIALADVLSKVDIRGVALLTSPAHYQAAIASADGCSGPDGEAIDLTSVFEARVFDGDRELRWWHEANGSGRAVVLAETANAIPADGTPLGPLPILDTIPGEYLLWGRVTADAPPGWTALTTARIGVIHVPLSPPPPIGARVRLAVREYVATEPEHGNAYVAEERLIRLEHAASPGQENS